MAENIWEHINDLKKIIIKIAIVWGLGSLIAAFNTDRLIDIFTMPLRSKGLSLHFLSPADSFNFVIKVVVLSGAIITLPILVSIFWGYIAQALNEKEKKLIYYYSGSTLILTVIALVYAYFSLIPSTFDFLINFAPKNTSFLITSTEYSNFVFSLALFTILFFQIPTVVFGLIKMKIVSASTLKSKRKEIYFAIIVLTALFGSQDILSWFIFVLIIGLLFEAAMFLAIISLKPEITNQSA